jgi:hypothetical protein
LSKKLGYTTQQALHDDVFWATALAVYATANMEPEPFLAVIPR